MADFLCPKCSPWCICLYKYEKGCVFVAKKISKKNSNPILRAAILSCILAVLLLILTAGGGALLILNGAIPEQRTDAVAAAATFLTALLAPLPFVKAVGKGKLLASYAAVGALLIVLLLTKWTVFAQADGWCIPVLVAAVAGATLSGLTQARKPKRKH